MSDRPVHQADERRYGKWTIRPDYYGPFAYTAVHDDYDGAPMYSDDLPSDNRCLHGSSVEDVLEQIREMEDENA